MRILFDARILCTCAVLLLGLGANRPVAGQETAQYTKTYANAEYGYSVKIPPPLVGFGDPVRNAIHGFRIHFSDDEFDSLSVSALRTTDEPAPGSLDSDGHPPAGFEALETQDRKFGLGGLDAVRIFQKLRRQADGVFYMMVRIEAKRQDGTVAYTVSLQAPQRHYVERAKVLDVVVGSFRLLALK